MTTTPVTEALESLGVPFRIFQHPGPVYSLEQAAAERGQKPEQIVRSLVFRLDAGKYAMVLVAGPDQIPWKALRRYFGQKRLTTATPNDVIQLTGFKPGSVSPFGLPRPIQIVVDQSVVEPDEISIGSGVRGTTVIMTREALLRALGDVAIVDLNAT